MGDKIGLPGATIKDDRSHGGTQYVTIQFNEGEEENTQVPYIIGQMEQKGFNICSIYFEKEQAMFTRKVEE